MTGQTRLHSTPPEHAASDNDLLRLHEEGHQNVVAQHSIANGHSPASDGEAADDKYHDGKGQEKQERDSPEIVSGIKSRSLNGGPYSSRLTIHVSCSPQPHLSILVPSLSILPLQLLQVSSLCQGLRSFKGAGSSLFLSPLQSHSRSSRQLASRACCTVLHTANHPRRERLHLIIVSTFVPPSLSSRSIRTLISTAVLVH